jgi:hypothetical protein
MTIKIPKLIKTPFLISSFVTGVLFLLALTSFFRLQPEIPVFYSLAQKNDFLASKVWVFVFPCLSLTITAAHFLIISILKGVEKIIIQLFAWATVIIQSLLALSLIRIIFIIS